jgi:hypothetical protein
LVWQKAIIPASVLCLSAASAASSLDWQSRVTPRLLALWSQQLESGEKRQAQDAPPAARTPLSAARFDPQGRVQLDVHYDCSAPAPTKSLAAAGLVIGAAVHVPPLCSVEGWLHTSDLPDLAARSVVHSIDLPTYSRIIRPVLHAPALPQAAASSVIDGNGVSIMHADQYIQTTATNGTGVTIGVMSDDVASLAVMQSRGELPAHISILTPAQQSPSPTPTDEGTMLLEEMHAVAPGARLAFCAPQTATEYVSCLRDLIAAGASVVADDIEYPGEDAMSAQSTLAQSVQALLTQNANVMLFSAVGNENESFWQGAYAPTQLYKPFICGANGQADAYGQAYGSSEDETLHLFDTLKGPISLQWADPFGQNSSNFDLYVLDSNHDPIECIPGANSRSVIAIDRNPQNFTPGKYYLIIATPGTEFAGKFLKLLVYGDGAAQFSDSTSGGITSPQKLLSRVVTVGAVYGSDGVGSTIEPYSASGPVQLQFPTPTSLQAPVLVAPDGIYIDANDTHFTPAPGGLFYGTSASTPNVAGVAALLRATFPTLSAQRIVSALTSGAVPLGVSAAPNGGFGYGRVDAIGALQTFARPTISHVANVTVVGGTSSSAAAFTLGGTGKLSLSGTSDNSILVSFGASGGAQFAPVTCGSSTNSCTLTIEPALGQVGSAHLVISVTDGAGRSTSINFTVTVANPPPPTISVTSGGNQSLQSGNAASPATLSLSGTKQLTISVTSSNAALLPASATTLSSGCGASSFSCTVTLQQIAGQSGQATLTLTARDPYGQTAQGTLSVSIAAPPAKSGGGAFASWSLVILGMLLAGRVVRARKACLISR